MENQDAVEDSGQSSQLATLTKKHCNYYLSLVDYRRPWRTLQNLDCENNIYLWAIDFFEEAESHGFTRGSVWKASSRCLVAAEALDVQTSNKLPKPRPVLKTKTKIMEVDRRAPRPLINSHRISLNGQWMPFLTYSNIPIYDSESILCWLIPSWMVYPSSWTLMGHSEVNPEPLEQVQIKWTTVY